MFDSKLRFSIKRICVQSHSTLCTCLFYIKKYVSTLIKIDDVSVELIMLLMLLGIVLFSLVFLR